MGLEGRKEVIRAVEALRSSPWGNLGPAGADKASMRPHPWPGRELVAALGTWKEFTAAPVPGRVVKRDSHQGKQAAHNLLVSYWLPAQ